MKYAENTIIEVETKINEKDMDYSAIVEKLLKIISQSRGDFEIAIKSFEFGRIYK